MNNTDGVAGGRFAGRSMVITGASSGLGRELALQLSAEGARLLLFARSATGLAETARDCGGEVHVLAGDVSDPEHNRRLAARARELFPDGLDYLVTAAGISMWLRFAEFDDITELQRLMDTNYLGVAYPLHALLGLLRRRHGMICAISSLLGRLPLTHHSGYCAAKHALDGLLGSLRLEEPQLHTLLIYPAWISGTRLRQQAIGKVAAEQRPHDHTAVPVDRCATAIVNAMHARVRELTIPARYRYLPLLYRLFPTLVETHLVRRAQRQLHPPG